MLRCLATFWMGWVLLSAAVPVVAQHHPHDGVDLASSLPIPLFNNLGTYHHPITTNSELAQRYFNQGLRLIYGFNHDEAIRAFKEAARIDPRCAMAYWGIAHALGPNINLPIDPEREKAAYEAIQKAIALARYASERERGYIEALATRYSLAPDAERKALDKAYADAMRELVRQYPHDLDAATLFAAALMDLNPWGYWTLAGQPQPGTLEIVTTLENVLQHNPDHPGAIHYYIHAVEASAQPERALPYAKRLGELMPGAGHLVHMPSHIYMRVGLYADATESNVRAVEVDEAYIEKETPQGIYPMMYYPHNIDFIWAAASMVGRSAEAIAAARRLSDKMPADVVRQMPPMEPWTVMPVCALARFGKWDDILKEPQPPADLHYATAMWHYARGLAFIAKGQLDEAERERASVDATAKMIPADRSVMGRNTAADLLRIASLVVSGELAAKRGNTDEAIQNLQEAVRIQDQLQYTEPPPWYYPVRQSLGAVLLAANRPAEAETVYHEDLRQNPENGWSLFGLAQSLRAQQKDKEAATVEQRFQKAWAQADISLSASRF